MGKAHLEEFSTNLSAVRQGIGLHNLVLDQREWLMDEQPKTVERYRDIAHATYNVARLANTEGYHAYIIREGKFRRARGIATIILDQTVEHANEGLVEGTDVDYWLRDGETAELHEAVGASLLSTVKALKPQALVPVFTTVVEGRQHRPFGLVGNGDFSSSAPLKPFGDPAVLSLPDDQIDVLELTRNSQPSQLYFGLIKS